MARTGQSLSEVARLCDVSQSTVSRVLNNARQGRFSVSPEVRSRILQVADELNYRPSMAARNLTAAKTRLVAVLGISGLGSDRVGPIERAVGALSTALDQAGYSICLQFLTSRHGPFDPPPLRVDGIIAIDPATRADLDALEQSRLPYVSIDGQIGERGMQVLPDDAGGARLALEHLASLGHRRVAYLGHPAVDAHNLSVFVRRDAFEVYARQFGMTAAHLNLEPLPPDVSWESYYQPFLQQAILDNKATAVLAYSHFGALSLLRHAHDMGLSVPKDFSLICFNDEPVVRLTVPSITAIDLPTVIMGQRAAQMLVQAMESPEDPPAQRSVRLEETLVVRESTAPPSA